MDFFKWYKAYHKLSIEKHKADADAISLTFRLQQRERRKQLVESGVVRFVKGSMGYEVYVYKDLVAILNKPELARHILDTMYYTIRAVENAEVLRRD